MIAVTGATGHLGNVIARKLSDRGESVTAVVRAASSPVPYLELPGVRQHIGALDEPQSLVEAFRGASCVVHAAALIAMGPGASTMLHRVNVEGTRNVLRACRCSGVRRIVYVGSIEGFDLRTFTEQPDGNAELEVFTNILEYGRTKAIAAKMILSRDGADGMERVVVCPTALIGPHDYKPSDIGRFVRDAVRGRARVFVDGGFDFADVRDVADGCIAACERGTDGGVYVLGGHYVEVRDVVRSIDELNGRDRVRVRVPRAAFPALGAMGNVLSRIPSVRPRFTAGALELLSLGVRTRSVRARRELGYSPRPFEQTIADTVRWFCRGS